MSSMRPSGNHSVAQPKPAGPRPTTSDLPSRSRAMISSAPQCENHKRSSCQRGDSTNASPSSNSVVSSFTMRVPTTGDSGTHRSGVEGRPPSTLRPAHERGKLATSDRQNGCPAGSRSTRWLAGSGCEGARTAPSATSRDARHPRDPPPRDRGALLRHRARRPGGSDVMLHPHRRRAGSGRVRPPRCHLSPARSLRRADPPRTGSTIRDQHNPVRWRRGAGSTGRTSPVGQRLRMVTAAVPGSAVHLGVADRVGRRGPGGRRRSRGADGPARGPAAGRRRRWARRWR